MTRSPLQTSDVRDVSRPSGTGQSTTNVTVSPEIDSAADAAASTNFAAAGFICPNTCASIASATLKRSVFASPFAFRSRTSAPFPGGTARYSRIGTRE